jgi:hypothetical protein
MRMKRISLNEMKMGRCARSAAFTPEPARWIQPKVNRVFRRADSAQAAEATFSAAAGAT